MSYWILPAPLEPAPGLACLEADELILPACGLADLARAQGPDQIASWLRQLNPESTPEDIATLTQHYWRLSHEMSVEDALIIRIKGALGKGANDGSYLIGEIAGPYFRASRAIGMAHIWPVKWKETPIAVDKLPRLSVYANAQALTEIEDKDVLMSLRQHIPALRKGNTAFFRWFAIITLLFELVYFWPRGSR